MKECITCYICFSFFSSLGLTYFGTFWARWKETKESSKWCAEKSERNYRTDALMFAQKPQIQKILHKKISNLIIDKKTTR